MGFREMLSIEIKLETLSPLSTDERHPGRDPMKTTRTNPRFLFVLGLALLARPLFAGDLEYREESRSDPRPLRIHEMKIDLTSKGQHLAVAVGDDPDGGGPAEAQMVDPLSLASRANLEVAVNANAWGTVPPPPKGQSPRFVAGGACDVVGWVVSDGVERSPVDKAVWSFWVDESGRGHIGNLQAPVAARVAISGFSGLLRDGAVLPGEGGALHPRTALGLDAEGHTLTLVVVDGRQHGFSEGMSGRELAELMRELGCSDALNLDGGGSSIMIRDGKILNRPSEFTGPRPVPVMIGVRKTTAANPPESR